MDKSSPFKNELRIHYGFELSGVEFTVLAKPYFVSHTLISLPFCFCGVTTNATFLNKVNYHA